MSYPASRYLGDSGEISAAFRPASSPPELTNDAGGTVHYLATGASTDGKFGLYRWGMAPGQSGPEPHFHRTISESFFVLSGEMRLHNGEQWEATAGDFLFVPEGGIHGFRNDSGEPASMLILFTPGAPREDYFETLADAAAWEGMNDEQRAEFFARHDTYWV